VAQQANISRYSGGLGDDWPVHRTGVADGRMAAATFGLSFRDVRLVYKRKATGKSDLACQDVLVTAQAVLVCDQLRGYRPVVCSNRKLSQL